MLGTGPQTVCATCHEEGSTGLQVAQQMRASLESLKSGMSIAKQAINEVAHLGMDMSEAQFNLQQASTELTRARS